MTKKELKEQRMKLAEVLKEEKDEDYANGYLLYIFYCTLNGPRMAELPEDQRENITMLMNDVVYACVEYFDGECKDGFPEKFDLFSICSGMMSVVLEDKKVEGDTSVIEDLLLTAAAATFRMWFDKITNDDIIAFLEDKPHRELPDMSDSSVIFDWAMEQNIPCSDIRSFFEFHKDEPLSDEERDWAENAMDELRKTFDAIVPYVVEEGVPQEFIDENLTACKNMFMSAYVVYSTMPTNVDADEFVQDDERMNDMYDGFVEHLAGPEMKKEIKDVKSRMYFRTVFKFGLYVSHVQNSKGVTGRKEMFAEVTKLMAKKYKRKKR